MNYFDNYLNKHNSIPHIEEPPLEGTSIIVVIPAFNEPNILLALSSLRECVLPTKPAEVIVTVNYPENVPDEVKHFSQQSFYEVQQWALAHSDSHFRCHPILAADLPEKFAGVGLARKTGMDEAAARFNQLGNESGIICGFDADSLVDKNYLTEIENHFSMHPKSPGASIYFEHPVESFINPHERAGIMQYELHLRYLVHCMRYAGFPYAYHTVGSSFAVRASAYVKQGGMNKFKAGEDFYFLNKIIPLGHYSEINSTRVIPSGRVSDRVPFGTGASMKKWNSSHDTFLPTYSLDIFQPLKILFNSLERLYKNEYAYTEIVNSPTLLSFLKENHFEEGLLQVRSNSSSFPNFYKRFYTWFDAFRIIKYLNYASNLIPKQSVITESQKLLYKLEMTTIPDTAEDLLDLFREMDKGKIPVNYQQ